MVMSLITKANLSRCGIVKKNIAIKTSIILVFLIFGNYLVCVLLFFLAGLTDYYDGYLARKYKADVPFLRSKKLSGDHVGTAEVIIDAIKKSNAATFLIVSVDEKNKRIIIGINIILSKVSIFAKLKIIFL